MIGDEEEGEDTEDGQRTIRRKARENRKTQQGLWFSKKRLILKLNLYYLFDLAIIVDIEVYEGNRQERRIGSNVDLDLWFPDEATVWPPGLVTTMEDMVLETKSVLQDEKYFHGLLIEISYC